MYMFENPFSYVANPARSQAVGLAKMYFGLPDLDPSVEANQVQVYVVQPCGCDEPYLAISQPVRTSAGGVPVYNGTPVQLALDVDVYSLSIKSSSDAHIYYTPRVVNERELPAGLAQTINGIKGLGAITTPAADTSYLVTGYYEDTTVGGGGFVWDATRPYSDHNGGTVIAPPAIAAWDGTQADIATLLNWTGSGVGCWERVDESLNDLNFSAVDGADNRVALLALLKCGVNKQIKIKAKNIINDILPLPNNSDIMFAGGKIDNTGSISTLRQAVFMAGHWHPEMYGSRPSGSTDPYVRQVDRYRVSAPVLTESTSITLATPSDAANFEAGKLYFIASDEAGPQIIGGVEIDLPADSSVVKCRNSNATTGVVEFYDNVGFDTATAPWLCALQEGQTNQTFPIYLAENIKISSADGSGRSLLGFTSCCYNLDVNQWKGHWSYVVQLNGLVKSKMRGFLGTFELGAFEIKFCTDNAVVSDVIATCTGSGSGSSVGLISCGEGAKNLDIRNFKIIAPKYIQSVPMVQLQPGQNCNIYDGFIYAPLQVAQPVQFYSDSRKRLADCSVYNLDIYTSSRLGVRMGGNYAANTPLRCSAKNIRFFSDYSDVNPKILASAESSTDCEIIGCTSPNLQIIDILNTAVRVKVRRNGVAAGGSLSGSGSGALGVNENYIGEDADFAYLGTNKFNRSSFGTGVAPQASVEAIGAGRFLGSDTPTSGSGTEAGYDSVNGGYISARDRGAATYERMAVAGSEVDVRINADSILRFRRHGSPNRADFIVSDAEPEGVVTAPVNSICISSVAGNGKLWQKTGGGTSNTGWVEK